MIHAKYTVRAAKEYNQVCSIFATYANIVTKFCVASNTDRRSKQTDRIKNTKDY